MVTTLVAGGIWLDAGGITPRSPTASSRALIATLAPFGNFLFRRDAGHRLDHHRRGDRVALFVGVDGNAFKEKRDALAFLVIGTLDHLGQAAGGRLGDVHGGVDRAEPCAVVSWSPEQSS